MIKSSFKSRAKTHKDLVSKWVIDNVETLGIGTVSDVGTYSVDRTVEVQPITEMRDEDGVVIVPPAIGGCPVILQGSEDGFIHFPLNVGTKVLIGYPKRSIEEFTYSDTAGTYLPVDSQVFGSAQAVVLGYAAQAGGVDYSLSPEDFEIRFKQARMTLKADNTISLTNPQVSFEASPDGSIGLTNGIATLVMNSGGTISLTNAGVTFTMDNAGTWNLTGTGAGTVNGATVTAGGNFITANGSDLDQLQADFDSMKTSYLAHGDGVANHNPPVPPPV